MHLYLELVRFRLTLAVTLSAATGYLIRSGECTISFLLLLSGVFLLAAGASVFNQYSERKPDAVMERTRSRPLPGTKIKPFFALKLAAIHWTLGTLILLFNGAMPALLGITTVFLYNVVYTRLKTITSLAVIPGAAVGALPPLIGFTSAGGLGADQDIILFSGFMFLWQLPHFWLILVRYREDYKRAGFKTFPPQVTNKQIRNLIFFWASVTTVFLAVFAFTGYVFNTFLSAILIPLNLVFIVLFYTFLYTKTETKGFKGAFIMINSFGLLVMVLFIINSFLPG